MSTLVVVLSIGPALVLATGAAFAVEPGASPKLTVSTYVEKAGRVTLIADSYVASLRESDSYVPIRVAIGVSGAGKPIRLGVESFTLIDRRGNAVPLASYQGVQSDHGKRSADEALFRQTPMLLDSRFDALRRIESRFYPAPEGRGTRTTRVELAPGTWFQDVLYFERPPAGVGGVLGLKVRARGLDRPVVVKFQIQHASEEDRPFFQD